MKSSGARNLHYTGSQKKNTVKTQLPSEPSLVMVAGPGACRKWLGECCGDGKDMHFWPLEQPQRAYSIYDICDRTLIRSLVTPMAVTSPPAPAPWIMSGLLPYRFV